MPEVWHNQESEGRQCRLSEIVARQSEGVAKFHQDHLDGCEKATSILTQRIDEVSLEMKEQQSEDVAASVSEENKDAKDMKQSASSNDNEQTEVEEEKVARSAFRR